MESKHTPGPWYWTASHEETMITDNDGGDIAWWPEGGGTARQCANARLISAAPEMLSACKEALSQISIFFDATATDLDKWDSDGSRPKNKLEIILERAITKAEKG